jgi:hypothetical protein
MNIGTALLVADIPNLTELVRVREQCIAFSTKQQKRWRLTLESLPRTQRCERRRSSAIHFVTILSPNSVYVQ